MTPKPKTSSHTAAKSTPQRTDRDSARWIAGLVLFFAGLFATASVLFYFLCWRSDLSVLQGVGSEDPRFDGEVENLCGRAGAWLGEQIVGRGFGLFGILLPVMVMLLGVRIIRRKPLICNHATLSLFFILILGSLTLGFLFGEHWSLISSSGWGGALGIEVARMLGDRIGAVGTAIVLLGGWILTGVFINRNFINTVNTAGNVVVDRSGRFMNLVRRKVAPGHPHSEEDEEESFDTQTENSTPTPETPAQEMPSDTVAATAVQSAATTAASHHTATTAPVHTASDTAHVVSTEASSLRSAAQPVPTEVERPTTHSTPNEAPANIADDTFTTERPQPEPVGTTDDSPFVELTTDESQATLRGVALPAEAVTDTRRSAPGRVVMGEDGLIELDLTDEGEVHPSQTGIDPVVAERLLSGLQEAPTDGPQEIEGLTELTLDDSNGLHSTTQRPASLQTDTHSRQSPSSLSQADEGLIEVTLEPEPRIVDSESSIPSVHTTNGTGSDMSNIPHPQATSHASEASQSASAASEGLVVTVEEHKAQMMDERKITTEAYDPLKDLVNYHRPPISLLEDYISDSEVSDEEIYENKSRIEETLKYFNIPIQRIKATVGPTVTLYEIVQAQGVKISKIQGLENDIAQSLKALGIRIIAPIPGKGTIGIEVPNRDKQIVSMYSAIRSMRFQESKAELPVVIGRTIQNENYVFDLAKMPHLLVAGATGQGKSVGLNAIITSLLYKKHPSQLKFVMIDPKMVEFSLYAKIEKHFLAKMESEEEAVITDPKKAVYTLNALCVEMDNRLELCKKAGARNIAEYNEKFTSRRLNPQHGHRYLPYIVVVVDEFADLIMTAREVEGPVMRLAQKARAIGIHLIIATQRPDVKVITGGIKANFPARIAFRVMQMIDSRTIIDQPGANQLIGRGDMLFSKDGELTRIQCALVETREVERIVDYISKQQGYTSAYALPDYTPETGSEAPSGNHESGAPMKYDTLFAEIARAAVSGGSISTSMIQRNYEVGFNRAGRIMLQLERAGIVGRQEGAKPRDVLYHDLPSLEALLQHLGVF